MPLQRRMAQTVTSTSKVCASERQLLIPPSPALGAGSCGCEAHRVELIAFCR